ncbi:MAG: hypothetical protein ACETWM_19415 [Candidatus Lokiarchaeia archaeon]
MKELLDHDTYIINDTGNDIYIIKSEDGNELGNAKLYVEKLLKFTFFTNLYDSRGYKWGTVKGKFHIASRGGYTLYDQNDLAIARIKIKGWFRPSYWIEDREGKKIYEISVKSGWSECKITDLNGSIVAQSSYSKESYTLKILNLKTLVALLITLMIYMERVRENISTSYYPIY